VLLLFAGAGAGAIPQHPQHPDSSPQLVLQTGHTAEVHALAFSPDGRWLASGGDDHLIHLWDVATARIARRLRGHTAPVRTIAFSPDGTRLVSGGHDETSIVWDLESGEPLRQFTAPGGEIVSVALSPNGRLLAAGSGRGTAIWEIATGRLIDALGAETPGHRLLMFSADGLSLIFRDRDERGVSFWALSSRRISREVPLTAGRSRPGWPSSLVRGVLVLGKLGDHRFGDDLADLVAVVEAGSPLLSPDGRLLAGRGPDRSTGLWEVATARQVHSLSKAGGNLDALAFSPDGLTLAVANQSPPGSITLWDVAEGIAQRELVTTIDQAGSVVFYQGQSGAALSLLTGTTPGAIQLWNTATGRPSRTTIPGGHHVRLRPDGVPFIVVASSGRQGLTVIDAESESSVQTIDVGRFPVDAWTLSADHRLLAYAQARDEEREEFVISVRELATGQERYEFIGPGRNVEALTFSEDNSMLLSTSWLNRTATLWDLNGGGKPRTFTGEEFELSPTGAWLASYTRSLSRTITLTNLLTGAERSLHDNGRMVFSPTGRYLATGHDGPVSVWDVETGRRVLLARTAGGSTGLKSFCPDERCVLVAARAKRWQLWEIATGREMIPGLATLGAGSSSFSQGMRWLAITSSDGGIEIWDLHAEALVASLYVMNGGTSWLVTTPSGFFDASDEDAARLIAWNVGNELHPVNRFAEERLRPGLLADVFAGTPPGASTTGERR
jgi:WD40 repeat protein